MVMESAAHQNFLDYMQAAVLTPLQLTNTAPEDVHRDFPKRAACYQQGTGPTPFVLAPPVDNSCKWASGGFISTPEDLVRFGSALLHPGFLQTASRRAMFTSQKTSDGKPSGYGIGWGIRLDSQGHPVWSHSGGAVGGTSDLVLYPQTGLVIAICCNISSEANPFDKSSLQLITDDFTTLFNK
jgi:serine beta-lactamase-like protein LACTB